MCGCTPEVRHWAQTYDLSWHWKAELTHHGIPSSGIAALSNDLPLRFTPQAPLALL